MRKAFEAAAQTYENVKKSVQEKWDGFKKKFEGTKIEMSQEVLNAKSPEALIALGKKLQEQGEALKLEEQEVKQEDTNNAHEEALGDIAMQTEAWDDNKQFDENKAAEKAEAERLAAEALATEQAEAASEAAAHEEYVRQTGEAEQARLAELRAQLNGGEAAAVENVEPVVTENKESMPMSEYEKIKGTIIYNKNGEAQSCLMVAKNNSEMMLEAYKINPKNIKLASQQLMENPDFIAQLDAVRAAKYPGETFSASVGQGEWEKKSRDIINSEDLMAKLSKEDIDKQKTTAVIRNLSNGIQNIEEMGVNPEFVRSALKKMVVDDLLEGNFGFYGGLSEGLNGEKVNKLMELAGDTNGDLLKDSEIKKVIAEQVLPKMCNRIAADKSAFEYIDRCISDISKTFGVTKEDWAVAASKTFNNSVRDYLGSNGRQ